MDVLREFLCGEFDYLIKNISPTLLFSHQKQGPCIATV